MAIYLLSISHLSLIPLSHIAPQQVIRGAYHPVTPSGTYYVDGILASTYVSYVPRRVWDVFGNSYIVLRYHLGLPLHADGKDSRAMPLFWMKDALDAAGGCEGLK